MTTATLQINQVINVATNLSPDITVCIRGRHAIGKSEIAYQIAEKLGLPVVERRLSQMTEGDLIGLPVLDAKAESTQFKPCDWLIEACQKPVLLFLDERNRALPAVKQAVFQLCDSRAIYGNKLHKDTRVLIAENIGGSYQVETNDPAEVSRAATCNLEPTVEEWITYAESKNLPGIVVTYIRQNPQALEHTKNFEPNVKYPDRRSWFKFAKEADRLQLLKSPEETQALLLPLAQMFLGVEVGNSFSQFALENTKRVDAKDIVTNWKRLKKVLQDKNGVIAREYQIECVSKLTAWMKEFMESGKEFEEGHAKNLQEFANDMPVEILMDVTNIMGTHLQSTLMNKSEGSKTTFSMPKGHFGAVFQAFTMRTIQGYQSGELKTGENK